MRFWHAFFFIWSATSSCNLTYTIHCGHALSLPASLPPLAQASSQPFGTPAMASSLVSSHPPVHCPNSSQTNLKCKQYHVSLYSQKGLELLFIVLGMIENPSPVFEVLPTRPSAFLSILSVVQYISDILTFFQFHY